MNIQRLMHVANRAKTIGDRTLANVIFAVLLEEVFAARNTVGMIVDRPVDNGPASTIGVTLETQDMEGGCPHETYYDLLTFEVAMSDERYPIALLCIPLPLVRAESAIAAIKGARLVERGEHNREHVQAEPDEVNLLWSEVLRDVGPKVLYDCATYHLCDEALDKMVSPTAVPEAAQS